MCFLRSENEYRFVQQSSCLGRQKHSAFVNATVASLKREE
jgi:hypothetical protein